MAVSKVILNGETLIDVTQKTVTPSNMLSGITALKNDGTDITGSIAAKSAADLITSGSQVTVPSGMYAAAVSTAIASGSVKFFDSYIDLTPVFTLNTTTGVVSASSQKVIGSIPLVTPGYVSNADDHFTMGSASGSYQLPIHGDLTASGSIVTAPSGWYGTAASTAIASGSIKALGLSINPGIGVFSLDSSTGVVTIDRPKASGTVYATITSAGYLDATASDSDIVTISSNSNTYALPIVSAAIITPTESSRVAVASGKFTTGSITVAAIPSSYVGSNVPRRTSSDVVVTTLSFSSNSRYDYIDSTVAWSSGFYENDGRKSYLKNILDVQELPSQSAITIVPTESSQIAVASRRWLKGDVTVAAISSSYVGSAVARRGAADLTAAGSVVSVPSGYYTADVSKAVAAGSITIPSHDFDIKPDITLNSATGKIDLWKSLGYTIPVSLTSGYITQASGPRVAATVDSSYQLPVKAAATIVPSTADQVVASGYFLTGAQTIKGDSALIPSNIAAGVSIFGVQGTYQDAPPNIQSLTVTPSNETQVFNAGVEKGDQIFYKYFRSQSTQNISTPLTNGKKYYVIIKTSTNDGSSFTEKYNNVFTCTTQLEPVSSTLTYVLISTTQVQLTSDYYDAVIVEILDANIIDGYSPVTVEAVAATTSYYLAQDSQGYITYSSIMPSGGEYYIFDVAGIKHIEGN